MHGTLRSTLFALSSVIVACSPSSPDAGGPGSEGPGAGGAGSEGADSGGSNASGDTPALPMVAEAEVVSVLEAELFRSGDPGGVIAVAYEDEILIAAAAGLAVVGGPPATVDMHFQAGSVTKMFTAALIMKLVEEGTLNTEDSIGLWTDLVQIGAPYDVSSQTLDLLLSHRAGHPNAAPEGPLFAEPCEPGRAGTRAIMQRLNPEQLDDAPGSQWSYSNHGYNLAGFVAQEAAGVYFADLMNQKIFEPAGMLTATFDESLASYRATGHFDGSPLDYPPEPPCGYFDPAGAVMALTITDMIRFAMVLTNDGMGVLEPESVQAMMTPRSAAYGSSTQYGYGLFIRELHGATVVGHPGSTWGYVAHVETVPSRKLAVAVMLNGDRADPTQIAEDVVGLYLNR